MQSWDVFWDSALRHRALTIRLLPRRSDQLNAGTKPQGKMKGEFCLVRVPRHASPTQPGCQGACQTSADPPSKTNQVGAAWCTAERISPTRHSDSLSPGDP